MASEDFELSRSSGLGSARLWAVSESYAIREDCLVPEGGRTYYFPFARPTLPAEIAKLATGSDDAIKVFARTWGLLGYRQIAGVSKAGPPGEPLSFIRAHADTIRRLLLLQRSLQSGDSAEVTDALELAFTQEAFAGAPGFIYRAGLEERVQMFVREQPAHEIAFGAISEAISANLTGLHLRLRYERLEQDRPSWPLGFALALDFRALIEVAYWHLAALIRHNRPLRFCLYCGQLFEQRDRRQDFCPPPEYEATYAAGRGLRRQSRCGLRYRQEKLSKGLKGKSEKRKGGSDEKGK